MTPTSESVWSPEALPKDVLIWQQKKDNRDFSKEFSKQRSEGKVFYQKKVLSVSTLEELRE